VDAFFQIVLEAQEGVPPDVISCGQAVNGCEIISVGDMPVIYRLNPGAQKAWIGMPMVFRSIF
jgi:hypothetical protein